MKWFQLIFSFFSKNQLDDLEQERLMADYQPVKVIIQSDSDHPSTSGLQWWSQQLIRPSVRLQTLNLLFPFVFIFSGSNYY